MSWTSYALYYTDLDRLLVDCVGPALEAVDGDLDKAFWIRHYAGGRHLRVHLSGPAEAREHAAAHLIAEAERYMAEQPSEPVTDYDPEAAEKLMRYEEAEADHFDLTYRVNEIQPIEYKTSKERFESEAASVLLEDFYTGVRPIILDVLRDVVYNDGDKRLHALRLYAVHSLVVSRGYGQGCVSFMSHWEGFRLTNPPGVIKSIEQAYTNHRDLIIGTMQEVLDWYEGPRDDSEPILLAWGRFESGVLRRAFKDVQDGHMLVSHANVDSWSYVRNALDKTEEKSEFLEAMYANSQFCESMRYNDSFTVTRVGVNLLYVLIASLGLNVLDKYTLCHAAQRAAQEAFGEDLVGYLRTNIGDTVEMNPEYVAA
ncbi:MAG: lantibiotic dehydratase C-terminal domain-containing protein [Bacteroidota bacterium]